LPQNLCPSTSSPARATPGSARTAQWLRVAHSATSPRVVHSEALWTGMHRNLCVTLPWCEGAGDALLGFTAPCQHVSTRCRQARCSGTGTCCPWVACGPVARQMPARPSRSLPQNIGVLGREHLTRGWHFGGRFGIFWGSKRVKGDREGVTAVGHRPGHPQGGARSHEAPSLSCSLPPLC
jgi:hypothetical protein